MPAVWLMLLDLCRTHGREQAFRELAIEFHRRFNVVYRHGKAFRRAATIRGSRPIRGS